MSAYQFKAGDPVVCVDAEGYEETLVVGNVYTVTAINVDFGWFKGICTEHLCLALIEAKGKTFLGDHHDVGFAACRFRPVQKRTTSIEIFTDMLKPSKVTA